MYKKIISRRENDDLPISFDRDCVGRQRDLTNQKKVKGNYHVRIILKDFFGFAEHQGKATYGLSFKLALTRIHDYAVFSKVESIADARIQIDESHWYLPHFTPSIPQQGI